MMPPFVICIATNRIAHFVEVFYFYLAQRVNLKALEAYEKAYRFLKNAENIAEHEEIVRNFFAFDTSKLFNETLVYYNHVYSYILSKMDDKGKFNLTKLAIQCEKKYGKTQ